MQLPLTHSSLRPVRPEDAPSIATHVGNHAVARNLSAVPHPYSLQDAERWIAEAQSRQPETHFGIVVANQVVGVIGLEPGDRARTAVSEHVAEIGYWLGESYWGRGIMSEAVAAVTEWAFHEC